MLRPCLVVHTCARTDFHCGDVSRSPIRNTQRIMDRFEERGDVDDGGVRQFESEHASLGALLLMPETTETTDSLVKY